MAKVKSINIEFKSGHVESMTIEDAVALLAELQSLVGKSSNPAVVAITSSPNTKKQESSVKPLIPPPIRPWTVPVDPWREYPQWTHMGGSFSG